MPTKFSQSHLNVSQASNSAVESFFEAFILQN